jgi:carbon-monoxide dehydrogenase medium subunit
VGEETVQTPAPFAYERAGTVDDALALLQQHGLIDINDLTDLSYIRLDGSEIAIGAMTRHAELLDSALLAEHYAIFADAERVIADPIVRNRGTIGGSFCQADPSEDLAAVGSALGATLVIRGTGGTRTVPAREFHYETVVEPGEILTEIRVPLRPGCGSAYEKVERRAGDWAIAAAGAFVTLDGDSVGDVGIGLTAVGAEHFCAPAAEDTLRGQAATDETLAAAAEAAAAATDPSTDQRGPADYKRHLAGELARRALGRAVARARGEGA